MKQSASKIKIGIIVMAFLVLLAGNIYQYIKLHPDPSRDIVGTYCSKDLGIDSTGIYLAVYSDMKYHLYTQEKLLSEGTLKEYAEQYEEQHGTPYELTGTDGAKGQAIFLNDTAYVFEDGEHIAVLVKYDTTPTYISAS